jgi:dinuclear metal center YbgI/SA1388 family protein
MMVACKDLENYLNAYLSVSTIKDYCPNGLQIEGKNEIRKVATAVSASLATLQQCVDREMDALIVHHGLFWEKDPYPLVGIKRVKVELLLKAHISLFAYHLPLDAHREVGNNWQAAHDLGWSDLQPFGEYNGTQIGVKGTFSERSIEQLVTYLEGYYQHPATVALGGKRHVTSAALVSGGAYKELSKAAAIGLGCYITGNFDEPAWNIAFEEQIHFLALGHTATEKVGPMALARHLTQQFGLPAEFLDIPNPF